MNHSLETGQPDLARLFAQYLQRQALSRQASAALPGEVLLHEALPAHPPDPRLARESALSALVYLCPELQTFRPQFPPEWQSLVANLEPQSAVPLAVGNFPQMLRDLQPLLQGNAGIPSRPAPAASAPASSLTDWVDVVVNREEPAGLLLAAGLLRLGRHFTQAEEILDRAGTILPAGLLTAWSNERAALAWHRGDGERAFQLWQQQPASVLVLFNQGMAALFLGQAVQARSPLRQAVGQIPETDPWHHLGQLYLALADIRQ
jgi:hypothetical protein